MYNQHPLATDSTKPREILKNKFLELKTSLRRLFRTYVLPILEGSRDIRVRALCI